MADTTLAQNVNSVLDPNNPISQIVGYNPFNYTTPQTDQYIKDAFESLKPYYEKLYTEAQNDVNLAITRLKQDYDTGVRYATEDYTTATKYETDSVTNSLAQMGIQNVKDVDAKKDELNKRGIDLLRDLGRANR